VGEIPVLPIWIFTFFWGSALFWDITQRRVAIPHRRFGITYRAHRPRSRSPRRRRRRRKEEVEVVVVVVVVVVIVVVVAVLVVTT
jgi:hypothetical protein